MLTVEVLEDDLPMRALLAEWLAGEGYRVRACAGFGDRVRTDVDAVVVDLTDLPARGAETIRRVKSLYAGAALIGISTQWCEAAGGDSRQARDLGVHRLVSKPCSRRELTSAVAGALGAVA